jgi:hypothetical protein
MNNATIKFGLNNQNWERLRMNGTLKKTSGSKGQVMAEYAAVLAMFAGVAFMVFTLLAVFTEYGWRIISLVSLDYP